MWKSDVFMNSRKALFILLLFIVLTTWWLILRPLVPATDSNMNERYFWGATYQIMAIIGGILGLVISRSWGGFKSLLGRTIIAFSVGLLFQAFGQSVYSVYNLLLKVEAPYPSIGDIGFFGSIPFYIYGTILLAKVGGVKVSLSAFRGKIQAIVIPLVLLSFSYLMFLQGYQFDWSRPVQILLDFGYPIGQAIYVSIAILVLLLSRNVLGGIMRRPIVFLLIALLIQYCSDFNFLYQFSKGTWYVGGYGDFLYLLSYSVMTMTLIYIGIMFKKITDQQS